MISFRDYLTEPPKIMCGIARKPTIEQLHLLEDLHVEPYTFLVPKDREGDYMGEVHAPGIMKVTKFGQGTKYYAHREVGKDPIEFGNIQAASKFMHSRWKQHDSDLMDVHDALMKHYRGAHDKYETVLRTYGRGSSSLNHHLMGAKPKDPIPDQALRLDHALRHQNTPDNLVVYSGISNEHAGKVRSSDVVHHPAFLSTSLRMSTAQMFSSSQASRDILKIHVPADHPGAYVGDLTNQHSHEREFILPRGLKLRFHRDKEMIAKTKSGDFTVHHATIES
jgi:hypothetical protein